MRRLRTVGFIHRDFGDEVRLALGLGDVLINLSGILHGEQKFVGHAFHFGPVNGERMVNVRDGDFTGEFRVAIHKRLHVLRSRGLANAVRHVNGEKIRS